jgi:hypothetical protein
LINFFIDIPPFFALTNDAKIMPKMKTLNECVFVYLCRIRW